MLGWASTTLFTFVRRSMQCMAAARIAAMGTFAVLCLAGPQAGPAFAAEDYDLLLKNGRIVDGAGTPWYIGDLAIRDGKIAAIGRLKDASARRTIDAAGLVVAPGFIDMMGQTASPFLDDPAAALNLLTQGITTI